MRGIKFNIPLDVRTPSYSDVCDAAQKNISEMWTMDFWKEYIDTQAKYRYNYISLWSMHPFPSLVKVPEYPKVALDDVKRSRGPFSEYYSGRGINWSGPEFHEDNLETVKTITIADKIDFWRQVMAYGKSRNLAIYSIDIDSYDYKTKSPDRVHSNIMGQLRSRGKGIMLFHDIQFSTAAAIQRVLDTLQRDGYKIVHIVAKSPVKTLPGFDEL